MPIYEYVCLSCEEEFSVYQSISASEKDLRCPKCGSSDIKKKLSAFSCCIVGGGSFTPSSSFGGG